MSRYVGLLLPFLSFQLDGGMSAKLSSCERPVRDCEIQSRGSGHLVLGMHDSRVKEHLFRNTARLDSWIKTPDEILEIARTQQDINSQPAPMQLGATPKGKGKGKGNLKPTHVKHPKANVKSRALQRKKECFYCEKKGFVWADGRKRQKDLALTAGRPMAAMTTTDAGQAANVTITPQLAALPRGQPIHVNEFLACHTTG